MPAPNHSIFVNTITKFVVGFGLAGGAVWKGWSMVGGDHHDHEALERTSNAKEMEKLLRRHSSSTNLRTGELHGEAASKKAAL